MPSGHAQIFHPAGHPLRSSAGIGALPLVLILVLGLALRLYAWEHAGIVNSDGAIYIHQARALYFGLWDFINAHSGQNYGTLPYPTITTLSIAALYVLCGDWITSGTLVSLLFGTATIVPLYGLIRTFFRRDVASLATLVYAVTPILIDSSVDIIRDPACWFFLTLGLYFFARQERRPALYLLLSNLSFILAAWSRVETVIFIVISAGYLFWDREARPCRRAALFLLPTAAAFLAFIGSQMLLHPGDVNWYRVADIPSKLQTAIAKYHDVHMKLTELIAHPQAGIPVDFFDNVRDILWFVGFGVLFQNTLETFFYPYCLIYLAGLKKLREKIREERQVLYFALLTLACFGVLYIYVFLNWEMENRWVAIALFPSFMFLGFGLERTVSYLQSRHGLKRGMALALVGLVILALALVKNTRPRGEDKIVFRQVGETIARLEGNAAKIEVLTVGSSARWISFYANLGFRGAPYPDEYRLYGTLIGASYEAFLENLKSRKILYLVWEEKNWPAGHFDFLKSPWERDFIRLGAWSHPDTGKIILFKRR